MESTNQNPHKKLVDDIKRSLSSLGPPMSTECCIYRVPKKLRQINEAAYTPQVVSIGPLHHRKKSLKKMETQKLYYLQDFLGRDEMMNEGLEELVSYIKMEETRIRLCYAESFGYLNSDQFVKMVLVDAVFILELFFRTETGKREGDAYDFILDTPKLQYDIDQDLILLENQLPFFILKDLYNLTFRRYDSMPSFADLTLSYFYVYNDQKKAFPENAKHFTDLLRYFQLPCLPPPLENPSQSFFSDCSNYKLCFRKIFHFINPLKAISIITRCHKSENKNENPQQHLYSATELQEAGVKFEVSRRESLLDIEFNNGKLLLPYLRLEDSTEIYIRNMMALEQCHYPRDAIICDYIQFMDYLINTGKDVELLVKEKIIINWLGDHQAAADLVNKLGLQIFEGKNNYNQLFRKLNEYYEVPYHSWKATLIHEYFRSPWRGASTIAAIILLVLTAIQTVCSVIGLYIQ